MAQEENNNYADYISWPLFPVPDEFGQMNFPDLQQSVRQSIEVLLRTRPGEQLMRPQYGAGLENYLHQSNTLTTRQEIKSLIIDSLKRWEKRIELDRVEVWDVEENPLQVRIEIAYRISQTGQANTVGLTMDMGA